MIRRYDGILVVLIIVVLFVIFFVMQNQPAEKTGQPFTSEKNISERSKTLIFLGDTMLGRLVNDCILENDPEFVWGDTLSVLQSADAVIDNLEVVIAEDGTPWKPQKVFYFKADPKAIDVLRAGKITYVTNANNHAMDYDREALTEMLDRLNAAGISHSGAGRNLEDAMKPAIISVGDLKIAIIAWTDNESNWKAGEDLSGVYYLRVGQDSLKLLSDQILNAKKQADLVVIAAHWGPNMVEYPPRDFQQFAKGLIDAGADIFYGHSSHVFQGVEAYKGKLIMYDTGDFIDDYAVDPELRNDMSFIFKVIVDKNGSQKLELIPVLINGQEFCQVNLAHDKLAKEINAKMERRSADFGTIFEKRNETLILNL